MKKEIVDIESKLLRHKNILAIPSIHSRSYFALAVREAYEKFKPDCIAIEHPESFSLALREAVSRLPVVSMIIRAANETSNNDIYIPIDPCDSIIEATRLAIDDEVPFFAIDDDVVSFPSDCHYIMPDDYALVSSGLEKFYKETKKNIIFFKDNNSDVREYFMAKRLKELSSEYKRVLFVVGISHWESIKKLLEGDKFERILLEDDRPLNKPSVYTIAKTSLDKVLGEMPFTTYMYELYRNVDILKFDKLDIVSTIFKEARNRYKHKIPLAKMKAMYQFLRNMCLMDNYIVPDAIDLLTASKAMVNNEYALEVLEGINYYPYIDEEDERYPVIQLSRDPSTQLLEGIVREKKIKLERYSNVWKTSFKKANVKVRPPEKYEGEWRDEWDKSNSMMSHIPEDVLMERYMNILRDKIKDMLTIDKAKIEPFRTSMKDGIDIRETIRHYYKNEVYVKEVPNMKGNVGHIVVIFDDENDKDYDCKVVWYSEAHDDSDLILYSTEPGYTLVGPGISKCYFGGYASLMPPVAPYNVWEEYDFLKREGYVNNYSDLLLYSAIVYSSERYLGYLAPNPPSEILKDLASSKGVQIIYLPINSLASETVLKLRSFHVLGNKRLRDIANRYIL